MLCKGKKEYFADLVSQGQDHLHVCPACFREGRKNIVVMQFIYENITRWYAVGWGKGQPSLKRNSIAEFVL